MLIHSTNGYLAPEIEVIAIKSEGVICASGDIPGLTENKDPLIF